MEDHLSPEAEARAVFSSIDANSDGLLDPEEMRAAEEEVKAAEQKSGGTNMGGTPADLYAQADADGDGLISLAELSESLTALASCSLNKSFASCAASSPWDA